MFVPVTRSCGTVCAGSFGWELGGSSMKIRQPRNRTNGNARMHSARSQLRVFFVMLHRQLGKKIPRVNHSDVDEAPQTF